MAHFFTAQPNKPNRKKLDPKYGKNKNTSKLYHLDYAKWAVTNALTNNHNKWLAKVYQNKQFYKGNQWIINEDLEAFLKDDTNQERNRIKIVHNLIRPMIEQYRGNSIILNINATAKSFSKKAINRRERALAEQILKTRTANEFPDAGEILRANDPSIGQTEEETTQIFNNLYVDQYTKDLNNLIKYVKELNEMGEMQVRLAQNIGLSGLGVTYAFEHANHQRYEITEPEDFMFDRNAQKYDLSDASFMGRLKWKDPADIFEKHQNISEGDRLAIETFVSTEQSDFSNSIGDNIVNTTVTNGRVPVYEMYWVDFEKFKYGWVLDEFGYPLLDKIDYIEEGEEKPRWTEEDLIDPPDSPKNRKLFPNGNKTRMAYIDVLRFASFIPSEAIAAKADKTAPEQNFSDILLEWGVVPYQERDLMDPSSVRFPFKCYCWGYIDGDIFSPIDDAINPQRFVNRVLSVTESQINNSGGANVIIDEDTMPDKDGSDEIYRNVAQGKPIRIRTKGRGVPNSIGVYDATPKQGTYKMFELIPMLANLIQNTSGVNEALKGESIGQDQLVGVTDRLIQKGSLMQGPFYNAITRLFVQMHQHTASVGKAMYIDNERELAIAVGDDGVEILKLSEDIRNEDFRVFIKRDNSDEVLEQQANQLLLMFKEFQMIDDMTFGNMFGRSNPDEVMMAVRQSLGARAESQRRQGIQAQEDAQAEAQAIQADNQAAQQEQLRQEGLNRQSKLEDQQHDIDKIMAKGFVDLSAQSQKNNSAG